MHSPYLPSHTQTAVTSIVLINQIVGPVLFKVAVRRVGEAGKAVAEGEFDPDADVPAAVVVGTNAHATSFALRLLRSRWDVRMLAATTEDAAAARAAIASILAAEKSAAIAATHGTAVAVVRRVLSEPTLRVRAGWRGFLDRLSGAPTHARLAEPSADPKAGAAGTPPPAPEAGHEEEHGWSELEHLQLECVEGDPTTRLSELVQSSPPPLRLVAALLEDDAANLSAVTGVATLAAAAPPRSHLKRIRKLAACTDLARAPQFAACGCVPLHEFSLAAAAGAALATSNPGGATTLLPATPGVDLPSSVSRTILGPPACWGALGTATPPSAAGSALAAAAVVGAVAVEVVGAGGEGASPLKLWRHEDVDVDGRICVVQGHSAPQRGVGRRRRVERLATTHLAPPLMPTSSCWERISAGQCTPPSCFAQLLPTPPTPPSTAGMQIGTPRSTTAPRGGRWTG